MRILIVEDETAAYENLADMLVTIDPTIEIMGNTESVRQTVRWLQANPRPDLILWIFIYRTVPLSLFLTR